MLDACACCCAVVFENGDVFDVWLLFVMVDSVTPDFEDLDVFFLV